MCHHNSQDQMTTVPLQLQETKCKSHRGDFGKLTEPPTTKEAEAGGGF